MLKPALFLHIQKTAGTSVQVAARWRYGNDQVCSHGDFLELGQDGCARFGFLSGHFGFNFARPLMPGRFCFTFLRQPQERLISLYQYCRAQPRGTSLLTDAALDYDLDGFLRLASMPKLENFLYNNMVWQLFHGIDDTTDFFGSYTGSIRSNAPRVSAFSDHQMLAGAKSNLKKFDFVGMTETASEDMGKIFELLGAPPAPTERHNESAVPSRIEGLPDSTRRLLSDLTHLDQKLYNQALRRRRSWWTSALSRLMPSRR
jgi:hypothetical protein